MNEGFVSVNEIVEEVIDNSMSGRIDGGSGSTRVLELPTAIQIATKAFQAGMDYAFAQSNDLLTSLPRKND